MRAPSSRSATPALALDEQARTVDDEGLRDPIEDPRGDLAAVVGRRKRAQDGELVAPEPHEQVVLGRAGGQAPRDLAEQFVARGMAEACR